MIFASVKSRTQMVLNLKTQILFKRKNSKKDKINTCASVFYVALFRNVWTHKLEKFTILFK